MLQRARVTITSALLVLAVSAAFLQAQTALPARPGGGRPSFGTGIEIINLTVSVTDPDGRYVTDLTRPDFAVFEDGIKQDLTLFTHDDLPISLVLMVDASASMDDKLATAQTAAVRFVKTLRAQDVAAVVQFSDRATTLQDFTADQAALEAAVRQTRAAGPTALHNALYVALKELQKDKQRQRDLRRRAIVLLSDGEDTASLVSDEQVLELARQSEVAIYAMSLRPNRPQDRERLAFSQAVHLLTVLARDSGGQVYFPNSLSELDAVYARIAEELRTQYNVGYVSNNARRDGRWRRIVVRAPRRPDLQIRHKLGYYAPAG
jgi:Ca-activated chloride channel family protein